MCRSVLERYEHNVHTFISLSSPQSGQYGGKCFNSMHADDHHPHSFKTSTKCGCSIKQ